MYVKGGRSVGEQCHARERMDAWLRINPTELRRSKGEAP